MRQEYLEVFVSFFELVLCDIGEYFGVVFVLNIRKVVFFGEVKFRRVFHHSAQTIPKFISYYQKK